MPDALSEERAIAATTAWLEKVVIGLNLCPFAKAVHEKGRIRFAVSGANLASGLLEDLKRELDLLVMTPAEQIESTLLIHPTVLNDFVAYNEFLWECDLAIQEMELDGVIQIASFHPQYQFAGTTPDDVTNHTNRSPFPMLHLLRESSVSQAVENFSNTDSIYENNLETLRKLGKTKIMGIMRQCMD